MSDDTQQPIIEGQAIPLDEMLALIETTEADIDDAMDWWDEHATTEFVGALE
jgi:hypothetical protein